MDGLHVILYLCSILSISNVNDTLYMKLNDVLLLIGCYCSDKKDLVLSSGQTVQASSADHNRLIS